MEGVLFAVQRISDRHVLCSQNFAEGRGFISKWFLPNQIPDEYGYIIIREDILRRRGHMTTAQQNMALPQIVADSIQEKYEMRQLRLRRLSLE